MNIIEAIKSGEQFRRKGWSQWRPRAADLEQREFYGERLDDLLAEDWEVLAGITITSKQYWEACREVLINHMGKRELCWQGPYGQTSSPPEEIFCQVYGPLAQKLGF